MVLALGGAIIAWVTTIVALLQHRARWLVCSAVCYAIQGMDDVKSALSLSLSSLFLSLCVLLMLSLVAYPDHCPGVLCLCVCACSLVPRPSIT